MTPLYGSETVVVFGKKEALNADGAVFRRCVPKAETLGLKHAVKAVFAAAADVLRSMSPVLLGMLAQTRNANRALRACAVMVQVATCPEQWRSAANHAGRTGTFGGRVTRWRAEAEQP